MSAIVSASLMSASFIEISCIAMLQMYSGNKRFKKLMTGNVQQ